MHKRGDTLMYNFRGVYGTALTDAMAYFAGIHAGRHYRRRPKQAHPRVLVASDHRFSGGTLKHFLGQGLLKAGCRVIDAGILPTPLVSYAAERWADGGCAVTASHNPPEFNGLKFFEFNGAVLKPQVEDALREAVLADARTKPVNREVVTDGLELRDSRQLVERYTNDVCSRMQIPQPVRVGVDCRLGMAGLVVPRLLEELNCEVHAIHTEPHPYFLTPANEYLEPEPSSKNLDALTRLTAERGLDLGLAFDADCDRVVLVDEKGQCVLDDVTLLLLAEAHGEPHQVRVVSMDISIMVEKQLRSRGLPVRVTPVGDPYVAEGLEKGDASFGGVPNGHYLFPGFNGYSDGLYAAAAIVQIVSRLKSQGMTLSRRVALLPPTYMCREKRPFGRKQSQFVRLLAPKLRRLFTRGGNHVDYLSTDDAVVAAYTDTGKSLVRYNRWDHKLNLQAESTASAQDARDRLHSILSALEQAGC